MLDKCIEFGLEGKVMIKGVENEEEVLLQFTRYAALRKHVTRLLEQHHNSAPRRQPSDVQAVQDVDEDTDAAIEVLEVLVDLLYLVDLEGLLVQQQCYQRLWHLWHL